MAHFEATVRLLDVDEADATAARRSVEDRLRTAGFNRWQIINLAPHGALPQGAGSRRRPFGGAARRPIRADMSYASGGLLVAAIVAWALWFLWLLAG